jgi:hypothetical protein
VECELRQAGRLSLRWGRSDGRLSAHEMSTHGHHDTIPNNASG